MRCSIVSSTHELAGMQLESGNLADCAVHCCGMFMGPLPAQNESAQSKKLLKLLRAARFTENRPIHGASSKMLPWQGPNARLLLSELGNCIRKKPFRKGYEMAFSTHLILGRQQKKRKVSRMSHSHGALTGVKRGSHALKALKSS